MSGTALFGKAVPVCAAIVTGGTTYFLTKDHSTDHKTVYPLAQTTVALIGSYFVTSGMADDIARHPHTKTYYTRARMCLPTIVLCTAMYILHRK